MTPNQEKELFLILGKLVNGVSEIQMDMGEIKSTLAEHSRMHTDHTSRFDRLESKMDSVASQVMENDKRTSARIESVERAVEDLGGKVH